MHFDQPEPRGGRPFGITVSSDTVRSTAAVTGELDIVTVDRLRSVLDGLRGDGYLEVTLDLGELDFVDARGLGLLVEADAGFRAVGGRLVLRGVGPRHRRLLAITELDTVLTLE